MLKGLATPVEAYLGGLVKIAATPANTSTLNYASGQGTFALEDPGATNAAAIENLGGGDVLELPGTSVSQVTFGTNSLDITTNAGTYDFTNVTYASGPTINSFTAAPDTSTGLEAITFGSTETFQETTEATSGPFTGGYLWSNPANWNTDSMPANGDSVSNAAAGFNDDDIAGLTLGSLTQSNDARHVCRGSVPLNVGTVASAGDLLADAFLAGAPVTVTVGTITETEGVYQAVGTGAVLVDNSATDPGDNLYVANDRRPGRTRSGAGQHLHAGICRAARHCSAGETGREHRRRTEKSRRRRCARTARHVSEPGHLRHQQPRHNHQCRHL